MSGQVKWRRYLSSMCLVCAVSLAQAQVHFPISGYRVEGNTLLSEHTIASVTKDFAGPNSDFETIQRALEALEKAYLSAGYGSVLIEVPEQELDAGVVTLRVVEGVLGGIAIQADPSYDTENVRHSLPALVPGQTVNIFDLNRNLLLANEGGAKVTNVTFKRSSNNRDVDATVKVQGDDPQRWLAVLDNTGSDLNGHYRMGLIYQNANVWNRDHSLLLQLMSSPGHVGQVRILGVGYRVPLYRHGDAVEFNASDSNDDSRGTDSGTDIAAVGKGRIAGVRYNRNLESSAELQHKLGFGLETRRYGNSGNTGDSSLSTLPFTLSYSGNWRSAQRDWSWNAAWLKNIATGPHGRVADLNAPGGRAGARAGFQAWKLGAQFTERFVNHWTLRATVSAQFTQDLLIAAEQFGVGGADSVRGFGGPGASGDQGARVGLELGFAPWTWEEFRLIPHVFVDAASVRRNSPLPGEIGSQTLSSAGLGLRLAYGRHASARADWGRVMRGMTGSAGAAPTGAVSGDSRLHMSLAWNF